ncbi:glycosyltransferase family 2 protein [Campylobacter lari]|uniref:Glycosyltransferase family 2 protein n=2 Tax=Campylobacter lari TaxID=201 RepID=A0A5L4NN35_CAMLA|nr:glycosyltransferase family 2 protein [Campylobacter sp. CNRCH_2013_0898h]EAI3905244.1 glycosyltransferase family 2 protein [Campylobacter lari]EAI3913641.1 glycosyltransferase family 2 protein [Campylobacter lari]EAI4447915.1 glycosyltransferase family 2 protein [Campylobacter lari]EAI4449139.1 glycosyltransferase family 2 protein [Campylobacter lari]EAJ6187572.1 glycosyltransferase family 2 protein [Campylobacter lari]
MSQISIILPTYNVEKYIARALESCINQTFKDIEIIVVDDCGSDKSVDIAKEYASKDDRIKIIHNEENLGTFASRNIGVLNAKSDFIMFLDPDDYLELNACEECVKILNKNGKIDLIWFDFLYRSNNTVVKNKILQDNIFSINEYCRYVISHDGLCYWTLCSKIIKKEIYTKAMTLLEYIKTKLTMAEDALMYFFIIQHCKNIQTSSLNIYYYYQNSTGSMLTNNKERIQNYIKQETQIIKIMNNYLKNNKLDTLLCIFLTILIQNIKFGQNERKIQLYKKNYLTYLVYFKLPLKINRKRIILLKKYLKFIFNKKFYQ